MAFYYNVLPSSLTPVEAEPLLACRVCLATETRLFNLHKAGLADSFCDLTGTPVSEMDGLPQYICGVCSALLVKSVEFRLRCRQTHIYLQDTRVNHPKLSTDIIRELSRLTPGLKYSLSISDLNIGFPSSNAVKSTEPVSKSSTDQQSGLTFLKRIKSNTSIGTANFVNQAILISSPKRGQVVPIRKRLLPKPLQMIAVPNTLPILTPVILHTYTPPVNTQKVNTSKHNAQNDICEIEFKRNKTDDNYYSIVNESEVYALQEETIGYEYEPNDPLNLNEGKTDFDDEVLIIEDESEETKDDEPTFCDDTDVVEMIEIELEETTGNVDHYIDDTPVTNDYIC